METGISHGRNRFAVRLSTITRPEAHMTPSLCLGAEMASLLHVVVYNRIRGLLVKQFPSLEELLHMLA